MRRPLAFLMFVCVLGSARSQSINVDFGADGTAPSAAYSAAGLPGTWNSYGVLPEWERFPLVGLDGAPVAAKIYMFGGVDLLVEDDPGTGGDDEALIDDMLTGLNDPVDVCIWFEDLEPGDYEVLTYAKTPADAGHQNRVRVDFGDPGPVWVGGPWPGGHEELVTYARHEITVGDGVIAFHSGEWGTEVLSGINGVQIRLMTSSSVGEAGGRDPMLGRVFPNPARGEQYIELHLASRASGLSLEVIDSSGRLVRSRALAGLAPGRHLLSWDGRDGMGRETPAAVYYLRVDGPEGVAGVRRIVRVH